MEHRNHRVDDELILPYRANRADGIFGNDKHFGGPYIALLNHPELAQHVEELGFF